LTLIIINLEIKYVLFNIGLFSEGILIKIKDEELENYMKAGKIASKVRESMPNIIRPNRKILDACEDIENMILKSGGKLAFPCNIGINEVTAHYTPLKETHDIIPENSIIKIDLGVHIEGFIADTAITISLDPVYDLLKIASEEALEVAIRNIKPGKKVSEIGQMIEDAISKFGLKPIRNLTGHKMERFSLHAGKAIPNVSSINGSKIEDGEVYAIEPFVTFGDASGFVRNSNEYFILKFVKVKGTKTKQESVFINQIRKEFASLPFTERWLVNSYPIEDLRNMLNRMISLKCIMPYHVLIEESNKPVAQSEHTVLINKDGCEVTTR
jgi:methionyl aminopeptidase